MVGEMPVGRVAGLEDVVGAGGGGGYLSGPVAWSKRGCGPGGAPCVVGGDSRCWRLVSPLGGLLDACASYSLP